MNTCFLPTNIYLPTKHLDMAKWSVIACDQYTSQPDYWMEVQQQVKGVPSTYQIIYPEVYLNEKESRIPQIHEAMRGFLEEGILTEQVHGGFVLTERHIGGAIRLGLVGMIDLEQYEYMPERRAAVRATEGTILTRIPPRVEIRRGAPLECPHVMILLKDEMMKLIEPLYEQRQLLRKLYEFELMLNGGSICGYAVEGERVCKIQQTICELQQREEFIFAVGDGNHSLAAAKEYWTQLKRQLSPEEQASHPARYSMVELVNLYSPAIVFEPIHRVVFHTDMEGLLTAIEQGLTEQGISIVNGNDIILINRKQRKQIGLSGLKGHLPIEVVQKILDEYIRNNSDTSIDYVHGEENVRKLTEHEEDTVGIILGVINKENLYPAIQAGGVLPRKAFSMGEADEKRFYLECRKIIE
ncbi:DUF1015 domain-containing protein [Bariatricus massiliensis]|uniref:DUF1015 domain-containing protein n=1 Tax=Bariatricus massiliensis TaxID=1745713 RepID=A0ABS8DDS2_9FIRM|nr:DUF1015 domain-containing protein [Bariatricus massiliensis]MCB7303450.1 DUF1015 domain-containing protein [Bariatricus massiliensis]MCB7373582.1 DUF1015 domain-containing protein [Bariatricus massiliensis]MCB7386252.1 DUF1015 domain-containing protein [Bariatricus massiliensis]MCB7410414.1 DUF1015 domain-containing protein [Bariatricus massiliensis]MCQ5252302.1 DUF1015 domain-containing protein [Bariatricus massiliensis]